MRGRQRGMRGSHRDERREHRSADDVSVAEGQGAEESVVGERECGGVHEDEDAEEVEGETGGVEGRTVGGDGVEARGGRD
jgi:hypothetical protein